jgi:hypothetical protein
MDPIEVTVNEYWLNMAVSTALPMLTALVTSRMASSGYKAWVLIGLAVLTGFGSSVLQNGGSFELYSSVANILLSYAIAVLSHFGLWKPINVTGSDGAIQKKIESGIGG